jgi:AcrR family transcriptional regulator
MSHTIEYAQLRQGGLMGELWTKQRRLEHTRNLLIAAAQDVFARKGFTGATLDDIAATAGYTRGAFYVHFKSKEDIFLAVNDHYYRRFLGAFTQTLASIEQIRESDLNQLAQQWQAICLDGGTEHAALGYEFSLYLLRNPDSRNAVAEKRRELVSGLADFVVSALDRLGARLTISPRTFAQILISTSDSIMMAHAVDQLDLFEPMINLYTAAIVPSD